MDKQYIQGKIHIFNNKITVILFSKRKSYFAIFGGGGIRGISYCGAYKALSENNINLTGCAGSSIGAVFATLYTLQYSYEEIYEIYNVQKRNNRQKIQRKRIQGS